MNGYPERKSVIFVIYIVETRWNVEISNSSKSWLCSKRRTKTISPTSYCCIILIHTTIYRKEKEKRIYLRKLIRLLYVYSFIFRKPEVVLGAASDAATREKKRIQNEKRRQRVFYYNWNDF